MDGKIEQTFPSGAGGSRKGTQTKEQAGPEGSCTHRHRKETTMSNQPEHENQQNLTPEEVRQSLLAEIDATKQAIAELSNEQLEEVVGGGILKTIGQCFSCSRPQTLSSSSSSFREPSFREYVQPDKHGGALSPAIDDSFSSIVKMVNRPEGAGRSLDRTLSAPGRLQGH